MLAALDILNRLLGYFNIQDKPKGQAFTIVALIANFYLLYIGIQNVRYPDFRWRGIFFLAVFFVLLYFIVLNVFYYFTDKKMPFDISPKVEKALGGNSAAKKAAEQALVAKTQNSPATGVFADDKILPATIASDTTQQANIDELTRILLEQGLFALDYQGLDETAIKNVAQKTKQSVYAMGGPVELPFFDLQQQENNLVVFGGLNALTAKPLGTVTTVGLTPVDKAQTQYQFAVAHAYLTGGEYKQLGRSGLITKRDSYTLTVQLAYTEK